MTRPVSSATTASGTMAHQPVTSMAVQAARTVCASGLVTAATPSARYATTAPIHPTEQVRWIVSANLRTPGVMSGRLHTVLGVAGARHMCGCIAGEMQSSKRQDQDNCDDPNCLHPTWGAGRRFAIWLDARVVAGVGVRERVSRVLTLGRSVAPRP